MFINRELECLNIHVEFLHVVPKQRVRETLVVQRQVLLYIKGLIILEFIGCVMRYASTSKHVSRCLSPSSAVTFRI